MKDLMIKTVNELRNYKFLVPSYQRGYRWTENEVLDLLNDIDDFNPSSISDEGEKSWYCLQPIVVKLYGESYEVIDGQQRLTTIYLILHYLNSMLIETRRKKLFGIDFETRQYMPEFLEKLNGNTNNNENVDFYHISKAYSKIVEWFSRDDFDVFAFQSKFEFNTKVIWFESSEKDSISIFTRINMGKIPLTNAELIKALFLNKSNFSNSIFEKIRLKQLEISGEWDRIEQSLQDNDFWYFLTNGKTESNRIDYIFQIMNPNTTLEDDRYSTFKYFSLKLRNLDEKSLDSKWLEVKNYYQRFFEWFSERNLYHKVGFLVAVGYSITELLKISTGKNKKDFVFELDNLVRHYFRNVNLSSMQYGDDKVKDVLLLYNIQTMLNNSSEKSRFPFSIYKNKNWDIEHITSVKDKMPETVIHQKMWLDDASYFIEEKELKTKVSEFETDSKEDFSDLYDEVVSYFNKDIKETDINDLSNLALLDTKTNRGYKNAVFPVKRLTIIEKEKSGDFIPLCTKNTFLKYFSQYPPRMSFWTQEDRVKYFNDIVLVLEPFIRIEGE